MTLRRAARGLKRLIHFKRAGTDGAMTYLTARAAETLREGIEPQTMVPGKR
jgi:delta-aminolevulinic acid dehydratase/porphobilinogen synthase